MICIGYAGCEAFDVVLYIGRTITKLNSRILIIDLSSSNALYKTIKNGMDLDSSDGIVNYRDINYIRKVPSKDELEAFSEGVVFILYGFNDIKCNELECNTVNIVVNTFPHMIDNVNNMIEKAEWNEVKYKVLIRDVVFADDVDRVKKVILPVKDTNINYLYYDIDDYENALECQIKQVIRFTKITARMEKYILQQIQDIFPNLKTKKIKKAIAAARKGV